MIENLLKQHGNFGSKERIVKALTLLKEVESVPIADLRDINIPNSTIKLLQCLDIVEESKDRVRLVSPNVVQEIPLVIYRSLFEKLKAARLLHDFLNEENLHYDRKQEWIFVKNNRIPLKFSPIRNLLLSFDFFLKDPLISYQFYIHPDYQDWFRNTVVPDIESSKLADNPLSGLIKRRAHQEEAGKQAELFVLEYEKRQRKNHENVGKIKIISELDTGAGYDIDSYVDDDSLLLDKFIEVKSYTGEPSFYWSSNEAKVAKDECERYYLYLVDRDSMKDKNYHPIQISDPANCLFADDGWICRDDGYFFEKRDT